MKKTAKRALCGSQYTTDVTNEKKLTKMSKKMERLSNKRFKEESDSDSDA